MRDRQAAAWQKLLFHREGEARKDPDPAVSADVDFFRVQAQWLGLGR